MQAEGGETERDEGDEDKCCHDSDSIEARGDDPCSAHDGVSLARGQRPADERQGAVRSERTSWAPSGWPSFARSSGLSTK